MLKTELLKASEELGLGYDAKSRASFGTYRGYKIAIKEDRRNHIYRINFPIKALEENQKENIHIFLKELSQNSKLIKKACYDNFALKVELIIKGMAKNNISNIIELVQKIERFASVNSYNTCCESCGESISTSVHLMNDMPLQVCDQCYKQTIDELDNAQLTVKNKKGNVITGLVGAFIGSLIGVALWVIVYALGYIATVCGIVLAVCIVKGYEMLGGKLNKTGVIITVLMTISMVYVANYLSYGYEVYNAFKNIENIDVFQAVRLVKPMLSEYEEAKRAFMADLALGYVFTSVGAISVFVSAYKTSNLKYTVKKLEQQNTI